MASTFPMVQTSNKIPQLFDEIRSRGRPATVTTAWLRAAGFKSSNDRAMLPMLKALGIVGAGNQPTDVWTELRKGEPDRGRALSKQIKATYADVFADYPNAHTRSRQQLVDQFRALSPDASDTTVTRMVSTFLQLVSVAGLKGDVADSPSEATPPPKAPRASHPPDAQPPAPEASVPGPISMVVNLNIELPADQDAEVYARIFESMAKHLGGMVNPKQG